MTASETRNQSNSANETALAEARRKVIALAEALARQAACEDDAAEQAKERQVDLARRYAETRGMNVVEVYDDAAISGASTLNRPGVLRLIADAQARKFDVIITESLDRLSRSQADIAALYERLQFLGVRIETLADGAVSEIHIGLKGTMSALLLKDLAQKTRRGQIGRAKAGRIPGGKSHGYNI